MALRSLPVRLLILGSAMALTLTGLSLIALAQVDPGLNSDSAMADLTFGIDADRDGRFTATEPLPTGQTEVMGRLIVANTTDEPLSIEWAKIDDVTVGGMCAHLNGYELAARSQINCDIPLEVDGPAEIVSQVAILQGRVLDRSFSTAELTKPGDRAVPDAQKQVPQPDQTTTSQSTQPPVPEPLPTPAPEAGAVIPATPDQGTDEPVIILIDDEPRADEPPADEPPADKPPAAEEPPTADDGQGPQPVAATAADSPASSTTSTPKKSAPRLEVAATISTDLALEGSIETLWHSPRALVQLMFVNRDTVPVRPSRVEIGDIRLDGEACGLLEDSPIPPAGAVTCRLVVDVPQSDTATEFDVKVRFGGPRRSTDTWRETLTVLPNRELAGLEEGDATAAPGRSTTIAAHNARAKNAVTDAPDTETTDPEGNGAAGGSGATGRSGAAGSATGDDHTAGRGHAPTSTEPHIVHVIEPEQATDTHTSASVRSASASDGDFIVSAPVFQIAVAQNTAGQIFVRITDLTNNAMVELPLTSLFTVIPAVEQGRTGLVGSPLPRLDPGAGGATQRTGIHDDDAEHASADAPDAVGRAPGVSAAQFASDQLFSMLTEHSPLERNATFAAWANQVADQDDGAAAETDDEINEGIQDFVAGTFQNAVDPNAQVLGATVERADGLAATGSVNSLRMTIGGATLMILGVAFVVLDRQRMSAFTRRN
ncbi:MAG: hypothetical protein KDB86_06950 [Actinobacteria bacterium]|nr:hypothetical protein [Actinomycetota bacterium]